MTRSTALASRAKQERSGCSHWLTLFVPGGRQGCLRLDRGSKQRPFRSRGERLLGDAQPHTPLLRTPSEQPQRGLLGIGAIQALDRGLDPLKRLAALDKPLELRLSVGGGQMPFHACLRRNLVGQTALTEELAVANTRKLRSLCPTTPRSGVDWLRG